MSRKKTDEQLEILTSRVATLASEGPLDWWLVQAVCTTPIRSAKPARKSEADRSSKKRARRASA